MQSYSHGKDGFIAIKYYLSPDCNTLCMIGCSWGYPYLAKFYKFENPLKLHYRKIFEIDINYFLNIELEWKNNTIVCFENHEFQIR